MYDYVLQYGFDTESKYYIQSIKDYLKNNRIIDRERNWLPHITIDLYNCKNEKEFIDKLDVIVEKISAFNIEFKNLNTCNNETLYIEPYNKEILMELKQYFNTELNNYMLEKRRERKYIPHATLCTSDTLDKSIQLANQKFNPFISTIKYIWVYNRDMQLIKEYNLK
ncbi:putative uncharacterized protein [Clostridium sp. CAG:575]|nr:putative uncharacterized protein [Clostridium sp. CAG:575]